MVYADLLRGHLSPKTNKNVNVFQRTMIYCADNENKYAVCEHLMMAS